MPLLKVIQKTNEPILRSVDSICNIGRNFGDVSLSSRAEIA
jgi:hypothetical protein